MRSIRNLRFNWAALGGVTVTWMATLCLAGVRACRAGRLNGLPGLDFRRDRRDISGERFPQDLIVNAVIDMRDENPVRADVVPRHRRYGRFDVIGELGGSVADPADHCLAGKPQKPIVVPGILAASNDLGSSIGGVEQVADDLGRGAVRGWLAWFIAAMRPRGCRRRGRLARGR